MKLTHQQRQVFRMLADARRPSGRQGEAGPLLLSDKERQVAFRLAEIGKNGAGLISWPAKEWRHLTAEECRAGLALLESEAGRQWSTKWSHGDPDGKATIAALIAALRKDALSPRA